MHQERSEIPAEYSLPSGRFLYAFRGSEPLGCIALSRHDDRTAEIKRLYVSPRIRSRGLGRLLVKAGLAAARELRYERLILETHVSMRAAHSLYFDEGFRAIDAPDSYPRHLREALVCMERSLAPPDK